jgi:hypothetical protein
MRRSTCNVQQRQNERQPKQPDSGANIEQWSESFTGVIRHRKFLALAKQLQE